ncbi:MAG TPA: MBL fold metallo-hydrolase [Candidatus Eremiobacteraceae bacterium]|jgi:7,8-dihydropterin-6-yl-methyl-4-(beta-D-ribofuranosyl)aminobenzene 5'-phosphate synthase|nr:MBL fold metallo-hydrolase [Candidatus Eremiobacteraceae bacterium]
MARKLKLALVVSAAFCLGVAALAVSARSRLQDATAASAPDPHAEVKTLKITILSTMLADDGIGEWGFSALVEADGHKILFDTGARPNTVLENAKELKIDLSDVQDVILSHFHDDHTTGLMTLRREYARKNPNALSRIHVAKGIFLERRGKDGNPQAAIGATNPMIAMKKEFEATGGKFIEHDKVDEIFPGIWLTGPVPRVFPEKNYAASIEVKEDGKWVEDNVPDDQSLVFNTDQGLVLLAGCGHSGIINTLTYARKEIRPAPVDAAIGGFHLFNASDETLDWTADKLKEFQTAQLMGAHCTGIESVYHLRQKMGLNRHNCVVGTVGATFDLKDGIKTGHIAR